MNNKQNVSPIVAVLRKKTLGLKPVLLVDWYQRRKTNKLGTLAQQDRARAALLNNAIDGHYASTKPENNKKLQQLTNVSK